MDVMEALLPEVKDILTVDQGLETESIKNETSRKVTRTIECNSHRTKCVVIFVCVVVLLCNGATIGVGIFLYIAERKQAMDETKVNITRVVLCLLTSTMIIAFILAVSSCVACVATLKENRRILTWCARILMFMMIFQFVIVVVGYIFHGQVDAQIQGIVSWDVLIEHYFNDLDIRIMLDTIQRNLECCGFTDHNDWEANEVFSCFSSVPNLACGVPSSCCKEESLGCAFQVRQNSLNETERSDMIKTKGCLEVVQAWYRYSFIVIIGTTVFLALSQVLVYWAVRKLVYTIQLKQSQRTDIPSQNQVAKISNYSSFTKTLKTKDGRKTIVAQLRATVTNPWSWESFVPRFILLKYLIFRSDPEAITGTAL